jgi:hypothetical protein
MFNMIHWLPSGRARLVRHPSEAHEDGLVRALRLLPADLS